MIEKDIWHLPSPRTPEVWDKLKDLLEYSASSGHFAQGFDPIRYVDPSDAVPKIPDTYQDGTNDSVYFITPADNVVATAGDVLNISAAGTENIAVLIFLANNGEQKVFMHDVDGNALSVDYTIPDNFVGDLQLCVLGADLEGNVYGDMVTINVQVNATPEYLFISRPFSDVLDVALGFKNGVQVSCIFSDNVERNVTSLPDVNYTLALSRAKYLGDGLIKGISPGLDTLVITYWGLTCRMPISIEYVTDYPCDLVIDINPVGAGTVEIIGEPFINQEVTILVTAADGYNFLN